MYPTFSFVIICKDEERVIERCLEAIMSEKRNEDEVIVIDTGSLDGTKKIISEFNDVKIYDFDWIDDFSEARNYGIRKSKKDWIFFIDADEILQKKSIECLNRNILKIDKISKRNEKIVFSPKVVNTDDSVVFNAGRIIKNDGEILFEGCIHEYPKLLNNVLELLTLKLPDVSLIHDGYEQKVRENKKKAERNTRLIKTILDKNIDNPRYYYFYYRDAKPIISDEEFEKGMEDFFFRFPNNSYGNQVAKDLAIHFIQKMDYIKSEKYIRILWDSAKSGNLTDRPLAVLLTGINEIEKLKLKQKEILDLLVLGRENSIKCQDDSPFGEGYQFDDLIGYLYFELGDYQRAFEIKNSLMDVGYSEQLGKIFQELDKLFLNS